MLYWCLQQKKRHSIGCISSFYIDYADNKLITINKNKKETEKWDNLIDLNYTVNFPNEPEARKESHGAREQEK